MTLMLTVDGEVSSPGSFDLKALRALPEQVEDVAQFAKKREGGAVWLRALLARAGKRPEAKWATLASGDGKFAICVPLEALEDRALLLYRAGDEPLPEAKGGPVRLVVAGDVPCRSNVELDACAQVKGLARIKLLREREADVGHSH